MVYYNLTNATTSTSMLGMMQEINRLSNYVFGFMVLIVFFIILFVAFKPFGIRTAMPASLFLSSLIGIFLVIMEVMPDYMMYVLLIATAGSVVSSIFINPEG